MSNNRMDLFRLAEKSGYEYKRCNGSHYIYQNKKGKIVVIPYCSKEITIGMRRKIEKDIRRGLE